MKRVLVIVFAVMFGVVGGSAYSTPVEEPDPTDATTEGIECMASRGYDASSLRFIATSEGAGFYSLETSDLRDLDALLPRLDSNVGDVTTALRNCMDELAENAQVVVPGAVPLSAAEETAFRSCLEQVGDVFVGAELSKFEDGSFSVLLAHGELPEAEVEAMDSVGSACVIEMADTKG